MSGDFNPQYECLRVRLYRSIQAMTCWRANAFVGSAIRETSFVFNVANQLSAAALTPYMSEVSCW